jgi:ribosome assembly protein 4
MATLLPPPKRAKYYHDNDPNKIVVDEPTVQEPAPNIVVQFVSEDDGQALAPAVNIPADFSREGLEALVNKLSRQVGSFVYLI